MQRHPHEQRMLDYLNELGNQTLEENIHNTLNQLKLYYPTPSPLPSYVELENAINESLTCEFKIATLLAKWNIEIDQKLIPIKENIKEVGAKLKLAEKDEKNNKNLKTAKALENAKRAFAKANFAQHSLYYAHSIRYCMVYAKLALKLNHEGITDKAFSYACAASFSYGEISANSTNELKRLIADQKRKNTGKRSATIKMVQLHAIELLKKNKPHGGWPSKQKAAEGIKEYLEKYVLDKKLSGITPTNVINTLLKKWSTEDAFVKSAFEAVLSSSKED